MWITMQLCTLAAASIISRLPLIIMVLPHNKAALLMPTALPSPTQEHIPLMPEPL